ncbi:MAG: 30S ribosomal protein S15 [Thermoproteota archaeon]|nr:MAG: 30S ribosomal protein S15 [Candidatus Korarchaeota archaeon]RLG55149.1 MAG: 30S ribosomal protein S15 [Candidatus Korarchaeota archaeon]
MGRMHARRKGQSHSNRPPPTVVPNWTRIKAAEIEEIIVDLAKRGVPPSQIGLILRDSYGVPLVKRVLGVKLTRILEKHGLAPPIPEDLSNLINKAKRIMRHLKEHKKDIHNKRNLQLVEAKIRRLVKYYKREGVLPPDWDLKRYLTI